MECYKPASDLPLVLVCSQAGSNDRIRLLGYRIIEKLGPTFINGRLGDIYAMAQIVLEKGEWGTRHILGGLTLLIHTFLRQY